LRVQGFGNPFGAFPPEEWVRNSVVAVDAAAAAVPEQSRCNPEQCLELIQQIQPWSRPLKSQAVDAEEVGDLNMRLSEAVSMLQGWSFHYAAVRGDFVHLQKAPKDLHAFAQLCSIGTASSGRWG
jgi:hypothetical protein